MLSSLLLASILLSALATEAGPITMDNAVRAALQRSPVFRSALLEADTQRIASERERPIPRPTLSLTGSILLQGPRVLFPLGDDMTVVLPRRYGQLGVTLDQPLYRAGVDAARHRFSAGMAAADAAEQCAANDLIRDVRTAYLDLVLAEHMVAVADAGRALASKHAAVAARMVEAGLAAARDSNAAQADLAEAEAGLVEAENGSALARGNLNRLIGRPVDASIEVEEPTLTPTEPESLDVATREASRRRPELLLLRLGATMARAGAALASLQNMPTLSMRASATHQTPSAFVRTDWAAVGLVLNWPILDGGKAHLDAREAGTRAAQLDQQSDIAASGIALELMQACSGMRAARARLRLADRQVDAATDALAVSELRYEQRAAIQLEVAASRLALTRARAAQVQARHDLLIAGAALEHAMGTDLPVAPMGRR